jgi:prolyl-tRNA synthetase
VSTRIIGAIIMVHGDDSGLVLPPRIAPIQVMVVPIRQDAEGVMEAAEKLTANISAVARAGIDRTDKSPGYKFAEAEIRGIPLRVEIGPKDAEQGKCVLVRRDTREKREVSLETAAAEVEKELQKMQAEMFERAKKHRDSHIFDAHNMDELKDIAENHPGFIRGMWCGETACEEKIKEELAVTSRCEPFHDKEQIAQTCVCCGKPAKKLIYWGKAY